MPTAFTALNFALDRFRTVLFALSLIVLAKVAWRLISLATFGY